MNFKLLIAAALFALAPILSAQAVLRLHDGTGWKEIDQAGWEKLPRSEVVAKSRDGKDRIYSGVAIVEILKLVSAPAGETLRGGEMNRVVLFTAADGYQTAFSLAELDPSFRKQSILLADRADGQPLTVHEGPRMLISSDDLRHSRWIRQVTALILIRAVSPE